MLLLLLLLLLEEDLRSSPERRSRLDLWLPAAAHAQVGDLIVCSGGSGGSGSSGGIGASRWSCSSEWRWLQGMVPASGGR